MSRSGWIAALLVVASVPAHAGGLDDPEQETPFDRGHIGLNVGVGEQTAFGRTRIGLGVGGGYFVLDGVEVGLFALHEFGDGPSINEVSPSLRYVAQPLVRSWPVIPYAGVFYNHWFLGDGNPDLDRIGAHAGLLRLSGRLIFGLGIAYEHTVSACATECDAFYPDVTIGFTF